MQVKITVHNTLDNLKKVQKMIKDNTSHYINQAEISSYLFDVRKYNALTRDEETELMVFDTFTRFVVAAIN